MLKSFAINGIELQQHKLNENVWLLTPDPIPVSDCMIRRRENTNIELLK